MVEGLPGGDRPHVHLVGEPMGQHVPPLAVALDMEVAVAVRAGRAIPHPAAFAALELGLESLTDVLGSGASHGAKYTTDYTEFLGTQLLDRLQAAA